MTDILTKSADNFQSGSTPAPLLELDGLSVAFKLEEEEFVAVDKVSFAVKEGKTLGIVGESGCGKSVTALSLLRLVPPPGRITGGAIRFRGKDLMTLPEKSMRQVRGSDISMVFQEPMTALNPVFTIGSQIAEAFKLHNDASAKDAQMAAIDMLTRVGIPDARLRAGSYPHQLSGGMRQRAVIAMALIAKPGLLIADEATTALDTTIQAQILDLLLDLQDEFGMAIIFISHNLGVVSEIADDVLVMYAGKVVEVAPASEFFRSPLHPYASGLLETLPKPAMRGQELPTIEGAVVARYDKLQGCRFASRCPRVDDHCRGNEPALIEFAQDHHVACWRPESAS